MTIDRDRKQLQLRSLVKADGELELSLASVDIPVPAPHEVLMRVDARVLALYYLAYATNGFFQHCNIKLHYGLLNYIVGSAETHRWHHSRLPRES